MGVLILMPPRDCREKTAELALAPSSPEHFTTEYRENLRRPVTVSLPQTGIIKLHDGPTGSQLHGKSTEDQTILSKHSLATALPCGFTSARHRHLLTWHPRNAGSK